jgi:hypothetical protein
VVEDVNRDNLARRTTAGDDEGGNVSGSASGSNWAEGKTLGLEVMGRRRAQGAILDERWCGANGVQHLRAEPRFSLSAFHPTRFQHRHTQ